MTRLWRVIALLIVAAVVTLTGTSCSTITGGNAVAAAARYDSSDPVEVADFYKRMTNQLVERAGIRPLHFVDVRGTDDAALNQAVKIIEDDPESSPFPVELIMEYAQMSSYMAAVKVGMNVPVYVATRDSEKSSGSAYLTALFSGEIWPVGQMACWGGAVAARFGEVTKVDRTPSDDDAVRSVLQERVLPGDSYAAEVLNTAYQAGLNGDLKDNVCDQRFGA